MSEMGKSENDVEIAGSKEIDPTLFDRIRVLLYRDNLSIEEIKEILVKSGESQTDILKAYEIILKHNTKADRLKEWNLMAKKPFIVPPALRSAVMDFESHFAVSGEDPIMILGETGVGKSLFLYFAKKLFKKKYENDERVPPIIEANCGHFASAKSDLNISRSELFGHVKGAFTGAVRNKICLIENADNGLLILEEIGELPFETQAMLLTFIETREYRRVGDNETRKANVKIVGATNRESDLRADFKYRFFPYYIPPLKERKGDILYYFYEIFPELTKRFNGSEVLLLLSHDWPGNVREIDRVGKLLMRNKWLDDQIVASEAGSAISRDSPRIYHLDPRDMSFNPDAVNELRYELKEFDVDLALLEKLLRQYRISLSEENIQSAFKELGEHSKYFSWFDQYSLKFCDEFQPFEDAYKGYLCFCGLFLQDTAKDDNILASMKECSFSHFDISQLDYSVSDEGRIQKLVKNIMRYLKGIKSPKNEPADDLSFGETWIALEEISNEGSSNNAIKEEEALRVISSLKEQDLLKLYYQKLLVRSNGNISRASRMAGVPESTFRDRMNAVGIKFRKKDCEIDEAEPR